MKSLSVVLMLLLWIVTTVLLCVSILGIVVANENGWFDIPHKLIDKL